MSTPRGYNTQRGYVGFFPDGSWMLFVNQDEYEEYFGSHCSADEKSVD